MTTTTANTHAPDSSSPDNASEQMNPSPNYIRAKARKLTLLVMLISFAATTLLQHVTQSQHHELVKNTGSEANISNLTSFSLALLLGGLRGPLVMMLWMSSENQKQDKDLDDFDSKIELIRQLQPEFDSVHLFQTWNKAYNVSVQMANKSNKYVTILDGIEYGEQVAEQKKNNINILSELSKLYFDKLGNSQEKGYYVDRSRRETLPDLKVTVPADRLADFETALKKSGVESARADVLVGRAKLNGSVVINKLVFDFMKTLFTGPGIEYQVTETSPFLNGKRVRLDTLLDLNGNLLPKYLAPVSEQFATNPFTGESVDGSKLQFLKQLEPFPYGVSPMAIGWNFAKRSEILRWAYNQKHIQMSDTVIDNRPAVNLKWWVDAETESGRRQELQAFDIKVPTASDIATDRASIDLPAAPITLSGKIADLSAMKQSIYHYDFVSALSLIAEKEYARHQSHFANSSFSNYREGIKATNLLCNADRDYLLAVMASQKVPTDGIVFGSTQHFTASHGGSDPLKSDLAMLKTSAITNYEKAATAWELMMLKYYVGNDAAAKTYPPGYNTSNIDQTGPNALTVEQTHMLTVMVNRFLDQNPQMDTEQDRVEAVRALRRIFTRLSILEPEKYGKPK